METNVIFLILGLILFGVGLVVARLWWVKAVIAKREEDNAAEAEDDEDDESLVYVDVLPADPEPLNGFDEDPVSWWLHNAGICPDAEQMCEALDLLDKPQIELLVDKLWEQQSAYEANEDKDMQSNSQDIGRQIRAIGDYLQAM